MSKPARVLGRLMVVVIATALTHHAQAAALFFEKTPVKSASEKTCFRFARDVLHDLQFQNVHKSDAEVAGEKDGAYISVTCVGRGGDQPAIAVVMGIADTFDVARRVGQLVATRVKGIGCIDSPC